MPNAPLPLPLPDPFTVFAEGTYDPETETFTWNGAEYVVEPEPQLCEWFALCDHPAVADVQHPILLCVPICQRCWDRFPELEEA